MTRGAGRCRSVKYPGEYAYVPSQHAGVSGIRPPLLDQHCLPEPRNLCGGCDGQISSRFAHIELDLHQ